MDDQGGRQPKGRCHNHEIDELQQIEKSYRKTALVVSHDVSPHSIELFRFESWDLAMKEFANAELLLRGLSKLTLDALAMHGAATAAPLPRFARQVRRLKPRH